MASCSPAHSHRCFMLAIGQCEAWFGYASESQFYDLLHHTHSHSVVPCQSVSSSSSRPHWITIYSPPTGHDSLLLGMYTGLLWGKRGQEDLQRERKSKSESTFARNSRSPRVFRSWSRSATSRCPEEKLCMASFVLRLVRGLSSVLGRLLTPDRMAEAGGRQQLW